MRILFLTCRLLEEKRLVEEKLARASSKVRKLEREIVSEKKQVMTEAEANVGSIRWSQTLGVPISSASSSLPRMSQRPSTRRSVASGTFGSARRDTGMVQSASAPSAPSVLSPEDELMRLEINHSRWSKRTERKITESRIRMSRERSRVQAEVEGLYTDLELLNRRLNRVEARITKLALLPSDSPDLFSLFGRVLTKAAPLALQITNLRNNLPAFLIGEGSGL